MSNSPFRCSPIQHHSTHLSRNRAQKRSSLTQKLACRCSTCISLLPRSTSINSPFKKMESNKSSSLIYKLPFRCRENTCMVPVSFCSIFQKNKLGIPWQCHIKTHKTPQKNLRKNTTTSHSCNWSVVTHYWTSVLSAYINQMVQIIQLFYVGLSKNRVRTPNLLINMMKFLTPWRPGNETWPARNSQMVVYIIGKIIELSVWFCS